MLDAMDDNLVDMLGEVSLLTVEEALDFIYENNLSLAFFTAITNNRRGFSAFPEYVQYSSSDGPKLKCYALGEAIPCEDMDTSTRRGKIVARTEKTGKWIPAYLVVLGEYYSLSMDLSHRPVMGPRSDGAPLPRPEVAFEAAITELSLNTAGRILDFIDEGKASSKNTLGRKRPDNSRGPWRASPLGEEARGMRNGGGKCGKAC